MIRKLLPLVIGLISCTTSVWGQYDLGLSQYYLATGYYNPAYAGSSGDLNMLAMYRYQWVGMPGSSQSFFATGDMPLALGKTNHGVGVVLFTENIGFFVNTHVAAQYAYKQKLWGGTLSIGLQAGIVNRSFDGTKVFIPESDFHDDQDLAIPRTSVKAMAFDINLGAYYKHKNFYAGFASTHITEPEMQLDENSYVFIGRAYNLMGGYNIQLKNPLIQLQPSVFLKTDMQSFQADVTARMVYNKMFNGGLSWRVNESVIFLLGATLGNFEVGYAYDLPTTPILKASSGSHELLIRYKLKLNKRKTGKNRHKSVRIL